MYLHHKEINVSSSSTFERKIVACVGGKSGGRLKSRESVRDELGFIGFSCAAQCFLCALPFYPIFNDSFGK